jgi:hypothetical protein
MTSYHDYSGENSSSGEPKVPDLIQGMPVLRSGWSRAGELRPHHSSLFSGACPPTHALAAASARARAGRWLVAGPGATPSKSVASSATTATMRLDLTPDQAAEMDWLLSTTAGWRRFWVPERNHMTGHPGAGCSVGGHRYATFDSGWVGTPPRPAGCRARPARKTRASRQASLNEAPPMYADNARAAARFPTRGSSGKSSAAQVWTIEMSNSSSITRTTSRRDSKKGIPSGNRARSP